MSFKHKLPSLRQILVTWFQVPGKSEDWPAPMLQVARQSLQDNVSQLVRRHLSIHLHRLHRGESVMRDWGSRLALYLYVSSTGRVLLWKVSILLLTASGLSSKFSRLSRRPRISLGSSLRWMILRVALMRFTWSWFTLTGDFLESFKVFLKKSMGNSIPRHFMTCRPTFGLNFWSCFGN